MFFNENIVIEYSEDLYNDFIMQLGGKRFGHGFNVGRFYENWDGKFEFYYNKMEEHVLTDYLANDKGWFVVSNRLQSILQKLNTEIQYLPVRIVEENSNENFILQILPG